MCVGVCVREREERLTELRIHGQDGMRARAIASGTHKSSRQSVRIKCGRVPA